MLKLSNSNSIKIFTRLLILLAIAKAISLGVWWYLPSDTQELSVTNNYQPKYQRVDFSKMIEKPVVVTKEAQTEKSGDTGISMTNMVLKGLYGAGSKGFVIVAMKTTPKDTSIIGVSEDFKGYTLKSINPRSAVFVKGGKDYILEVESIDDKNAISKVKKNIPKRPGYTQDREEPRTVTREDINAYAKDPKQIWKEISISEVKEGNQIKGFKVTRIDKRSKFATLGLEQGDIIIKANNVELKSYRDALEIYKNIDKLDTVQIVVLRNNQEKELVYEVN